MGSHSQTGLVAVTSCDDYLKGVIKKHELTRPDKEDDRARHIETLHSQTGPVFLTYRAVPTLAALVTKTVAEKPDIDFTAKDGVRHTSWTIRDAATTQRIEQEFGHIVSLYIADGHHRCAAAARVYLKRKETNPHSVPPLRDHPPPSGGGEGQGEGTQFQFLPAFFRPNKLKIFRTNPVLRALTNLNPAGCFQKS